MTRQDKIKYGLIGLVGILVIVLLFTIFRSLRKEGDADLYKQLLAEKEERIKLKDEIIADKLRDNSRLDKDISAIRIQDSISRATYFKNQSIVYKKIDERLKNIPINIARIAGNDDSIRAAFARD